MFIVIARSDIAVALQKRIPFDPRMMVFRDADSLPALNAIVTRRPAVIAVDEQFAATARGAALIARVRADELLADTSVRVLTLESDAEKVQLLQDCADAPEATVLALSRPLNWCGTRHALRYPMIPGARALVNGEACQVVNLSATGVHLVSPSRLRPTEEVRLVLVREEDKIVLRVRAVIAWATLEIRPGGLSYRAGARFVGADSARIAAFCQLHPARSESAPMGPEAAAAVPVPDEAVSA
jgi:hypothetical protein